MLRILRIGFLGALVRWVWMDGSVWWAGVYFDAKCFPLFERDPWYRHRCNVDTMFGFALSLWGLLFILNNLAEGFLRPTSFVPPRWERDLELCWVVSAIVHVGLIAVAHPTHLYTTFFYLVRQALFFAALRFILWWCYIRHHDEQEEGGGLSKFLMLLNLGIYISLPGRGLALIVQFIRKIFWPANIHEE